MRADAVLEPLRAATRNSIPDVGRVDLAFSGGLDSTVLAALAREVAHVTLYTVGYPDYADLRNAHEASDILVLPWVPIPLDDDLLLRETENLLSQFPNLNPVAVSFELPLWILLQRVRESVVLAGQGADELFGGYARYEGLAGKALRDTMDEDLRRLLQETLPREHRMARLCGRDLRLPYCHAEVLQAVLPIEPGLRKGPGRKELLRDVAEQLKLPDAIVGRPKKAAQYGSGVIPRMRRLAKDRGVRLGEFLRELKDAR